MQLARRARMYGGSVTNRLTRQRDHANREVDVENPAPGVVVGDPAAERRADDGRHDDTRAISRHGCPALFDGAGLAARPGRWAACRLLPPPAPCRMRAGGRSWRRASLLREDDGIGDEIAGEDPGGFVLAGREAAGDVRQRHLRLRSPVPL